MTATSIDLDVRPFGGALGAEVRGLDLAELDPDVALALRAALDEHLVLALPGLDPSIPQFRDVGLLFGPVEVHPSITGSDDSVPEVHELDSATTPKADVWHTDVTFVDEPPTAAMLHMAEGPTVGGDTMWINCYDVFESLSAPMQGLLEGLTCEHAQAGRGNGRSEHPVVRVHPTTGRKGLFVNKQFSRRIPQLSRPESQNLLAFLFRWQEQVRFSCRWRWTPGDVVMWDERFTLHTVVADTEERRLLRRVTVLGDRPRSVDAAPTWPDHEADAGAASGFFGFGYEF